MKLSAMWRDAIGSLVKAPATERYPFVRMAAPANLRSMLYWDREACTGCGLCAKDCPAEAIEVFAIDKKAKRIVFRYNVDRCTFCAQCLVSCRQGSLSMASDEWELAGLTRDQMVFYWGEESDVAAVLAGDPAPDAEPAAEG